jgi:hypothetical protein
MLGKKPNDEIQKLNTVIDRVLSDMIDYGPDSPEYPQLRKELSKLYALRDKTTSKRRYSPDTLLLVGGNLLGIFIIVAYEHGHVITTKALSYIKKT